MMRPVRMKRIAVFEKPMKCRRRNITQGFADCNDKRDARMSRHFKGYLSQARCLLEGDRSS